MNCLLIEIGCNIQLFNVIKAKILCITYGYRIFRELRVSHYPIFDYYLKMKTIFQLLIVLMIGTSYAQSNLPVCQGTDVARWDNCFGTYTFANGHKYVGEWKDGKVNGQGTVTYADGDKYVGSFNDGKRNGQGTYTSANGHIYVGEFKDGSYNGQGTSTDVMGNKYVGEWKDGEKNGQGTFTFANGNKYVGEWRYGKYNGQGTLYSSNGSIVSQGLWADNKFISSAPVQMATSSNTELEKLRAEAEVEKKRREALEEQLRIAQQPTSAKVIQSVGKRVALVVGNNNYKFHPLKNSLNDANGMSRALRESGFEVIDLRDSTLPQMRSAVRQFGDKLLTYDVGLVYYSGHGVEVKGRNYFIPVNADIMREDEIADQGLDVSLILEKMSTAQKSVNILIVDACRDDPFGRGFRSTSRGLAQMDAPRGTIIAYATSPGKVASDGDPRDKNSPYTKHLLRAMQSPNKPIEQVFKEVRRAVQEETKNQQTPWENTSLSGDFYFKVVK